MCVVYGTAGPALAVPWSAGELADAQHTEVCYNNCRCSGATFSITTLAACLKVFELIRLTNICNQVHRFFTIQ